MKTFETFFKETTKYHLNTKSSSLSTYTEMIKLIDNYRDKEWATLFLFYSFSKLNTRLNTDGKSLIKVYVDKYKNWSNLEEEFFKNQNSLSRDFKPLKNYQLYLQGEKAKQEYLKIALEKAKSMKTSELAKTLNVSPNIASAFKRGEVNRISYRKVLNAKLI